jgi:hypothetical protein
VEALKEWSFTCDRIDVVRGIIKCFNFIVNIESNSFSYIKLCYYLRVKRVATHTKI